MGLPNVGTQNVVGRNNYTRAALVEGYPIDLATGYQGADRFIRAPTLRASAMLGRGSGPANAASASSCFAKLIFVCAACSLN